MAKRQYSDNDKATALAALDANGGNVNRTAKELNVPRATLQEWVGGHVSADVPNIRQVKKGTLTERFDDATDLLLDAIHEKIKDATLQQLTTSIGILQDKSQLLKGGVTERTEVLTPLDDTTRSTRIAALFDTARDRRDRQSHTPTDD